MKLKVKQCVNGSFRAVWVGSAHERRDGSFRGSFLPRRPGLFFARAYSHIGRQTLKSDKQYFRVI